MDRATLANNIGAYIAAIAEGICNGEATRAIMGDVDKYMTANPDSALRQALVAAEKALKPFIGIAGTLGIPLYAQEYVTLTYHGMGAPLDPTDLRRAREAHALIIEALKNKL